MEEELKTIETVDTSPFKHLVMTLGELPTSFVDSMTYYECLAWLVNFIQNTVIPTVNNNAEAVEELQTAFTTLKNYVDNYFDNLDVQEEINNKLDQMAEDGTLGNVISSYVQPFLNTTNERINNVELEMETLRSSYGTPLVASSVAGMTDQNKIYVYTGSETGYTAGNWYYWNGTEWTSGGVYNASAVQTDKTLLINGQPADAEFTGLLKKGCQLPYTVISSLMVNGSRNQTSGEITTNPHMITTSEFVSFDNLVQLNCPTGYRILLYVKKYQDDDSDPSTVSGQYGTEVTLLPNIKYIIRLQTQPVDETVNINVSDIPELLNIEYAGSIANANPMTGTAYNSDNKFVFNPNYITKPGIYSVTGIANNTSLQLQNLPVTTQNFYLKVYDVYTHSSTTYVQQEVFEIGKPQRIWHRLLNTKTHNVVEYDWTRIKPIIPTTTGKKLSIYGDSISTYTGYIPEGNATFYNGTNCGVTNVNQTWWKRSIDALSYTLLVNNSWSGRAVSSIKDEITGHTTDAGYKQANVDALASGGVSPDEIIINLGINDFVTNAPLGTYDGTTTLTNSPDTFSEAYALMLSRIMTTYPTAKVYCCTLQQCERLGGNTFPEINNQGDSLEDYNYYIRKLAESFGCEVIDLACCGITHYNLSTYTGDFNDTSLKGLHPNQYGMALIANKVIHTIDNAVRTRY